jgi:hypothetical protein
MTSIRFAEKTQGGTVPRLAALSSSRAGGGQRRPHHASLAAALLGVLIFLWLFGAAQPVRAASLPGTPAPKAPRGQIERATPTFAWSKARAATSYEVRVSRGSHRLLSRSGLKKLSWVGSDALPANVGLTWKVRARNSHGVGHWSKSVAFIVATDSPAKAITAFSFQGLTPPADGLIDAAAHTIAVGVPSGSALAALIATFSSSGASVSVAGIPQISGVTLNDFSGPVTYTVRATDGSTQAYVVTVTAAASAAKAITAFSFQGLSPPVAGVIDETSHTIAATVPSGTSVSGLVASFVVTGGSVTVGGAPQVSGTTPVDYTSPVSFTVTAADGSTQTYKVTVTVAASWSKALTAFGVTDPVATGSIDDALHTVAVTVPRGTDLTALIATFGTNGTSVVVAGTPQVSGVTANDFSVPVTYTVAAADGTRQGYVVTVTVAADSAKSISGFVIPGQTGISAIVEAARTIAVTVPFGTNVKVLKPTITTSGVTVSPAGGVAQDFTSPVTYTVTAADGSTQVYVVTVTVAPDTPKAITAFGLASPAATGSVNETLHTVAVTVPYGTDVTALAPTIAASGVSVSPAGGVAQDFTSPVTYTVTAADGSTQSYVVTVTLAARPAKAITAFSFAGSAAAGDIDEAEQTIFVVVPYGTDLKSLIPTITIVGDAVRPASGVAQDFTDPVTYTVTASDDSKRSYTVTVVVAACPPPMLTAFDFESPAATGAIDEVEQTVTLTVPDGTDLTALVPTISSEGESVSPASGVAQDFTKPVTYTVTALDGTTQAYVVSVTVAPSSAMAITAFSLTSPAVAGVIDETEHTIVLKTTLAGASLRALTPTITIEGASISPASGVAQDFTDAVAYTVTALNGEMQSYVVTVEAPDVGEPYQGGVIGYILQPDDPGYDADNVHGLIAGTSDLGDGVTWLNSASGAVLTVGSTGAALGTGAANTQAIVDAYGAPQSAYAAGLAADYESGGYSDWYLPSVDELRMLSFNREVIGGFVESGEYWTSTEWDLHPDLGAYWLSIASGDASASLKDAPVFRVRAVRSF